jgi:CYTH domain-containing protein/predicted ATPase
MSLQERTIRIVLTGGPCAGKTTALDHITSHLAEQGVKVFCVPEVASILIGGGADLGKLSLEDLLSFERNLIALQMSLEDTYLDLADRWKGPAVVICDRGTMDVSAYLPDHIWQVLLNGYGWTEVALRDARYDAVIHLESAAVGAPVHYTTENNAARHETPEQAASLDKAVQKAWVGHPHLRVISSMDDFESKVAKALAVIDGLVGAKSQMEIEHKYLVDADFDVKTLPVAHKTFLIEQTYLQTTDGSAARVRNRRADGASTYTHTVKRDITPVVRKEFETPISGDEYIERLNQADKSRETVIKERRCFLWEGQYFELDTFISPHPGLQLLEVELDTPEGTVSLPPFIPVAKDVTLDRAYTNYRLAAGPIQESA